MRCTTDFLVRSAPEDCPAVRHSLSGQTRFRGLPFFSCGAALTFRPEVYQTKVPCPAAGRYTRSARRSQPFREVANASPVRRPKGSHFYSRPRPQDDQLFGRHPMRPPPPKKKKSAATWAGLDTSPDLSVQKISKIMKQLCIGIR